jgi:hypothetical protein
LSQDTVSIEWFATDSNGDAITGLSDLFIAIERRSDNEWFDFDGTETFEATGDVTTRTQVLAEVDATNAPGLYRFAWDLSAITIAAVNDEYVVIFSQTASSATIPAPAEILADQWPAEIRAMMLGNYTLDNITYDANGFSTAMRMRLWDSSANVPASGGGAETTGLLRTITLAGTVDGTFVTMPSFIRGTLA